MRLLGMYHEIKRSDMADGETIRVLADQMLQVGPECGEGHEMYTVLLNPFTCMTAWEQRGLNYSAMVVAYV